jgi:integrase
MDQQKVRLYRRANGIYYIILETDGKKEYRSTHCTSKAEAFRQVAEIKKLFVPKSRRRLLLSDYCKEYLEYANANLAPGTVEIYKAAIRDFLRIIGDLPLNEIKSKHFDKFKTIRSQGVGLVFLSIQMRSLKASMSRAVKWEYIDRNPFTSDMMPKIPDTAPAYFTKVDLQKLFGVITEDWFREIVVFAVLTGMRKSEILNIRWNNVDMLNQTITIQSDANFKTKTGKRRTIPMNPQVFELLTKKYSENRDALVFNLNGKQIEKDLVHRRLMRSVRKANLDTRLHFHSLRHSAASLMALDGASIFHVCKILGHASVVTTEKFYAHLQPANLRDAINRISFD